MRILVTGATGLVGRALGKALVKEGHQVVALCRNPERAKVTLPFPAECWPWDSSTVAPVEAFRDVEAIVHLAGEGVADKRWSAARKKKLWDSRIEGTKNLIAGMRKSGARVQVFLGASAMGIYGDRGDEVLVESSSVGEGFLAQLCSAWEMEAGKLIDAQESVRVVLLRIGLVLSGQGGFLQRLEPIFKNYAGGKLGSGKQWMSWIHVQDLVKMILFCLSHKDVRGAVNAVSPQPVTNSEFTSKFVAVLKSIEAPPVPLISLKVLYGELASALVGSQRLSVEKIQSLGFNFTYADLNLALADIYQEVGQGESVLAEEQWLPYDISTVFRFFCNEKNLELITPPWLRFKVLGKTTPHIQPGTRIDYRLKLRGFPLRWQSLIESWKENESFIDIQTKGPYAKWRHIHQFKPLGSGVLIQDKVIYKLPGGLLGRLGIGNFVKSDIEQIFQYRQKAILDYFQKKSG